MNSDATGQVSRFDSDGNSLDAHDGSILQVGGTFYLYGTSYGCGYEYMKNSNFCGFKAYSSPDLVHWTDRGYIIPPGQCGYCFRAHVVRNAATGRYVMWADGGGHYMVATSTMPTGLFAPAPNPQLAVGAAVDMTLYVDDDGTGYVIHNTTQVATGLTADMVVERLTPDYLNTTGRYVRLGLGNVEAFAVFKRDGVYHALMSDPTCAYCAGQTGEMTATSMLGPWSGAWYDPNGVDWNGRPQARWRARIVNSDNCGGQPLAALPITGSDGETGYYFVSDRWRNRAPNEALANLFIGPMDFDSTGKLQDISCVNQLSLPLPAASAGNSSPDLDQSSGPDGFHHYCDIAGPVSRQQSFTPSRSGSLSAASVTAFRGGVPNAPATLEVVDAATGTVLSHTHFELGSVSWAPVALTAHPGIAVTAGHNYLLRLRSTTTTGCYGWEYNDTDPYPGGSEAYSTNNSASFTTEPARDLKFTTDVSAAPVFRPSGLPAGYTQCAAESGHCTFPGKRVAAYGAGISEGAYRFRTASDGTHCNTAAFGGDPLFGTPKNCYTAPPGGPSGYTYCASEGSSCSVDGPAMVAYGKAGAFTYKLVDNGALACNLSTFGTDPLYGVVKSCYTAPATPPAGWASCAAEGNTCASSSGHTILYGARGAFYTRWATGNLPCSAASFGGDPIPGATKTCYTH
ncbi:family 43 glycosylhydrolase [Streptomyces sp. 1222.5]|uniref:family 43 glycosylhydrolase n=1 Tax=Streptomyces sp. 1222.5 TaxID=1881026 RepID=UPI003D703722